VPGYESTEPTTRVGRPHLGNEALAYVATMLRAIIRIPP
jgi:hypothetical protein